MVESRVFFLLGLCRYALALETTFFTFNVKKYTRKAHFYVLISICDKVALLVLEKKILKIL